MDSTYSTNSTMENQLINYSERHQIIDELSALFDKIPKCLENKVQANNIESMLKFYPIYIDKITEIYNFQKYSKDITDKAHQFIKNINFTYEHLKKQVVMAKYSKLSLVKLSSWEENLVQDIDKIKYLIYSINSSYKISKISYIFNHIIHCKLSFRNYTKSNKSKFAKKLHKIASDDNHINLDILYPNVYQKKYNEAKKYY